VEESCDPSRVLPHAASTGIAWHGILRHSISRRGTALNFAYRYSMVHGMEWQSMLQHDANAYVRRRENVAGVNVSLAEYHQVTCTSKLDRGNLCSDMDIAQLGPICDLQVFRSYSARDASPDTRSRRWRERDSDREAPRSRGGRRCRGSGRGSGLGPGANGP